VVDYLENFASKWSFTVRIDMSEDSLFTIYGFGTNMGEGLSLAKCA